MNFLRTRVRKKFTSSAHEDRDDAPDEQSGAEPGGHVELWTIPDGSHFPSVSGAFAEHVVDYLLDHPKP